MSSIAAQMGWDPLELFLQWSYCSYPPPVNPPPAGSTCAKTAAIISRRRQSRRDPVDTYKMTCMRFCLLEDAC